jgi:molybdopterin biosynthesis enzyme
VLAATILSHTLLTAFDNSCVDGSAARAAKVASASGKERAARLVAADTPSASAPGTVLQSGTGVRILADAPFAVGAEAVVSCKFFVKTRAVALQILRRIRAKATSVHLREKSLY